MNTRFLNGHVGIAMGILALTLLFWGPRQWSLHQRQQALESALGREAEIARAIADQRAQIISRRQELEQTRAQGEKTKADIAFAEKELTRTNPDSLWTVPPKEWPDWNASGPYVWLRKDMLPKLNIHPFTQSGTLVDGVADVLTIPPQKLTELNDKLSALTTQAQEYQVSKAERVLTAEDGTPFDATRKVVVRVNPMSEEGARLSDEFNATLVSALGQQRANLLTESNPSWLEDNFKNPGQILNVEVEPDNTLRITTQQLNGMTSSVCSYGGGGQSIETSLRNNIPPQYLAYFQSLKLNEPPAKP